ncbi:MFS transporter [Virgibacillus dakarensis]|uniref:Metabolite transport protein n=1 Tax=Lentibacillus populi TaxID=1827502 RepID=A0A9W5TVF2_9BACI|nr:MFS transporter [Lentibacillus populi]MTW87187.1 MFS transporter [Virgibacillus dakarensis]GGB32023.1 putative metabolite transport protein [Lentibacillus populi]
MSLVMESQETQDVQPESKKYQWQTLWASGVGYMLDGLDLMVLSFTLPLIIAGLSLSTVEGGALSTITMLGAVVGGIIFGILADIYGRVRVFSWTVLIFSIFTGLCALAVGFWDFAAYRFLAGLGLGGEFGIGMTLVTETWPKKKRSRATSGVAVGYQVGIILASLATAIIAPYFGWRGVFLFGVLPAIFAFWVRKGMKEPELWKQSKAKRKDTGNKVPIKQIFDSPKKVSITIGLIIICGVQNFGFYGVMTWVPTALAQEVGFSFSGTTIWTVVTTIGMVLGILVFGVLADKLGRKPSFILFQVCSALGIWIYFQFSVPLLLILFGALLGFLVNGMMGGYGAVISEHYTTEVRSTAQNFVWNVGRALGGLGPLAIGAMAMHGTISSALGLISGVYIIAALAMLFLVPETKGKEIS